MMLFKLSLQNIKKSFKDYAIYFFTLILGVSIFYIFNSLGSQTVLLKVSSQTREIIQLMMNMLSMVSVFIAFVLGFLIIYASRFLMKRRHHEFGIYLTLGMGKAKISNILLLETMIIGIMSLIVGLGIGVLLSQIMSIFVANMFEADMSHFTFIFSMEAFVKTFIYFGIMYLCVMIFHTISIGKCKLIDLLQAHKKSEKIALKNPFLCGFIFLIGVFSLSYAYYLVTAGVETLSNANEIFLPITLGIVSTFFITWSLSSVLVPFAQKCKFFYYRSLNSFTVRQVSSKINTTVVSMSVITIMLFVTICVLSSALSIKNSMTANLVTLAPMDIQMIKTVDLEKKSTITGHPYQDMMSEQDFYDTKKSILETLHDAEFQVEDYFQDIYEFTTYRIPSITIEQTVGNAYPSLVQKYPYMDFNAPEDFVKLSEYNHLAEMYHLPTYELSHDEYILLADFSGMVEVRNEGLKQHTSIDILGKTYYPKYQECQNGFVYMSSSHVNAGLFIVPDEVDLSNYRNERVLIANYQGETKASKSKVEEEVLQLINHDYFENLSYSKLNITTKIKVYESSVGLSALVTFIGLYLGIIFLISSAAILALKELSESTDNKKRYQMLRKIGVDENMIMRSLFSQIAIFFFFPLCFAIVHSIFGIQFCNYILETFGNEKLLQSILMTAAFLILIYGGYFVITYHCSKHIVKEKTR